MVRRRGAIVRARAAVLAVAIGALGVQVGGAPASAQDAGTVTSTVAHLPPRSGTTTVVDSYDQAPTPSAPGATASDEELNEGGIPAVPRVEGGITGGGLGDPTVLLAPGAQGEETPEDLIFAAAPVVATDTATSTAEPQVAVNGDRMLVTWNWGAAQSFDGGGTFKYLDPYTAFPSAGDGFCCDQLAAWIPERDLWVWVLQYISTPGATGSNVLRLAVASGDEAFDGRSFTWFDFTAQDVGFAPGVWLDQPKLGWSDDALFLSVNGFNPSEPDGNGRYVAAVVWRLPIDGLVSGDASVSYFTTEDQLDGSGQVLFGPYPVRDAGSTMVLAAHFDQATLGVWSWSDADSGSFDFRKVPSRTPSGEPLLYPLGAEPYTCPIAGAADPESSDWCRFGDDRLVAGWRRGDVIGFAWNVPQSPDWQAPFPWVWAMEIDATGLDRCGDGTCVVGYPSIWLADRAVQYPALAGNARGDLGGVVLIGGGRHPLGCLAVTLPRDAAAGAGWNALWVAESDADSPEPRSGDYLGVAPSGPEGTEWVGTCMTLHGGGEAAAGAETGTKTHVHVTTFGKRADLES